MSDRLLVPEKLYGREREIEALLAAFNRVVATGTRSSYWSPVIPASVSPPSYMSCTGRSIPPRGLFAAGKFDQYKRDIPYATVAQAFQSLVRRLLGEATPSWPSGATRSARRSVRTVEPTSPTSSPQRSL